MVSVPAQYKANTKQTRKDDAQYLLNYTFIMSSPEFIFSSSSIRETSFKFFIAGHDFRVESQSLTYRIHSNYYYKQDGHDKKIQNHSRDNGNYKISSKHQMIHVQYS